MLIVGDLEMHKSMKEKIKIIKITCNPTTQRYC